VARTGSGIANTIALVPDPVCGAGMSNQRIWQSYTRGLRLQRRSDYTIRNYSKSFRMLAEYLKDVPVTEATRTDLEGFFDQRFEEVLPSTVHSDYVNLRPFFNWLIAEDYITRSPMARIPAPDYEYKIPRVLDNAELKALFNACKGPRFYDKRDEAMLRLMSEVGGSRRAEVAGLLLEDVDFDRDTVKVSGKTGIRWIPFGAKTGVALDRYLRLRDKSKHAGLPNLWLSYRGAVPHQTVWWIVKRRSLQAGIGAIHPHTLRHTAAHRAHEAGMSDQDMETLFGWQAGSPMSRAYGRATKVIRAQNSARKLALGDSL
jgi:site-specific recombinase XerD